MLGKSSPAGRDANRREMFNAPVRRQLWVASGGSAAIAAAAAVARVMQEGIYQGSPQGRFLHQAILTGRQRRED